MAQLDPLTQRIATPVLSAKRTNYTKGLLDTGSETILIMNHAADTLGLEREVEMIRLGTFHGKDPLIPARNVNLSFKRWRRRIRADNVERRQHCASEQPIVVSRK